MLLEHSFVLVQAVVNVHALNVMLFQASLRVHFLHASRCAYSFSSSLWTLRCAPTSHTMKPAIHSMFLQILYLISVRGPLCLLKHVFKFQALSENMTCYF